MPYIKEVIECCLTLFKRSLKMLFDMPYLKEVLQCCYISVTSCPCHALYKRSHMMLFNIMSILKKS